MERNNDDTQKIIRNNFICELLLMLIMNKYLVFRKGINYLSIDRASKVWEVVLSMNPFNFNSV